MKNIFYFVKTVFSGINDAFVGISRGRDGGHPVSTTTIGTDVACRVSTPSSEPRFPRFAGLTGICNPAHLVNLMKITVLTFLCATTINAQTWNIGSPNPTDVTAKLTADGTLTISGTGEMARLSNPGMEWPWQYVSALINTVIIEDGITSIGNNAFSRTAITSITIPNSVSSIGNSPFSYCNNLTAINVAGDNQNYSSVDGVLFNKSRTTLILYPVGKDDIAYNIPNTVNTIDVRAFAGAAIITVDIPNSVTAIGNSAFSGAAITSVDIPSSVTSIGDIAFRATALTSVTIPNSVTSIGMYAFADCLDLNSITVEWEAPIDINHNVFQFGNSLLTGRIPMTLIIPPGTKEVYAAADVWKDFYIDEEMLSGDCGDNLVWTYDIATATLTISGTGNMYDYFNAPWFAFSEKIKTVDIEYGITGIGSYAFSGCWNLEPITIPNSVTSIGSYAFSDCWSFETITIPNSVNNIGYGAFSSCINLISINVAGNHPNYSSVDGVLFNKSQTTLIYYPSGKQDDSYIIPNDVTDIADRAFYYSSLTSVKIPNSVTAIGNNAFNNLPITEVTVEWNSPISISNNVFSSNVFNVNRFATLNVPSGTENLYANARGWMFFDIPGATTNPGGQCGDFLAWEYDRNGTLTITYTGSGGNSDMWNFDNSSNNAPPWSGFSSQIHTVLLPNNLASIGSYAFYGMSLLESLNIPGSVTFIGSCAFEYTVLLSITVNWNSPIQVHASAFTGVEQSLTTLHVPPGAQSAYRSADVWSDFYFAGDPIPSQTKGLCGDEMAWEYDMNGTLTITGKGVFNCQIPNYLQQKVTTLILPDGLTGGITSEGLVLFRFINITAIDIPYGVESIGGGAFNEHRALRRATIPESVNYIGVAAFQNTAITSINIPEGVIVIRSRAFSYTALTSIDIPASATAIENAAFANIPALTSVTVHWEEPILVPLDIFENVNLSKCILYVPSEEAAALYRNAPVWRDFGTIITGFAVDFDTQGGSAVASQNLKLGDKVVEPDAPTRAEFVFGGWYREAACINAWNFAADVVTSDITLFARWLVAHTVTFNSQDGSAVASQVVGDGLLLSQPAAPTRAGFAFGGWYKEAACINAWNFANDAVTASITLYAKWIAVFTVSFDSQGGSAVASQTIPNGSNAASPEEPTREGYQFEGWYKEAACINAWDFEKDAITANITLFAKWTVVEEEPEDPKEDIISVAGVSLNRTSLRIAAGVSEQLVATVTPANASNQSITWRSSNRDIAIVDPAGKVTGISAGNVVITAITNDGDKTATCTVTVTGVLPTGVAVVEGSVVNLTLSAGGITVYLYIHISFLKSDGLDDYVLVRVTETDTNGKYIFENLPEGSYVVVVETDGLVSAPSAPVNLTGGVVSGSVDFTVDSAAGTVIAGEPNVVGVTSADEFFASELRVYPNPFTGAVRIVGTRTAGVETRHATSVQIQMQIINSAGAIVHTQMINSDDETINLEHLPAGVYVFRFENDGKVQTVRGVKN